MMMKDGTRRWSACGLSLALLAGLAACAERAAQEDGVLQTKYPGQVSAGGGTSGEVLAGGDRDPVVPGPEGTPGIPQGAGGTVGGAAMGGTTAQTPPVTQTDEKSAEQARKATLPEVPGPLEPRSAPPGTPSGPTAPQTAAPAASQ